MEKVIGILGGMGPEATLDCFAKIIRHTPAETDQEHLRVVIESNPKVPDRTAAIVGEGESPVPLLAEGAAVLARAGADFIIMPCVSAHVFLKELRERITLPFLSIFDAVAEALRRWHPQIRTVGLMGTTGTMRGGLLEERLARDGIRCLLCDQETQARVMAAIYEIKQSRPARSREAIRRDLRVAAETLIARGAQGIVAGCTEIPLALDQEDLAVPYFDSILVLARAAIRRAGKEPL